MMASSFNGADGEDDFLPMFLYNGMRLRGSGDVIIPP
jgi:hypothetical protein